MQTSYGRHDHRGANSASGAVPVVPIRGGITKADFKTAAALQLSYLRQSRRHRALNAPQRAKSRAASLTGTCTTFWKCTRGEIHGLRETAHDSEQRPLDNSANL